MHEDEESDAPQQTATLPQRSFDTTLSDELDTVSTPINTIAFFEEPDPAVATAQHSGQESSASPPPPSATALTESSSNAKVDTIPEDTEKDEYRDEADQNEAEHRDDSNKQQQTYNKLSADLATLKAKIEQIGNDNKRMEQELQQKSQDADDLTHEYEQKLMEYDKEYEAQQKLIEEEERCIEELEREFQEKLAKHNIDEATLKNSGVDSEFDTLIRNGHNNKHAQKSSIVLYDNSFAINHQLQLEIDKLMDHIGWLKQSKIQLVKNTATEVDRLRGIIKQFPNK